MSEQSSQNLANHTRNDKKIIGVSLIGAVTLVVGVVGIFTKNSQLISAGVALSGLGVIGAVFTARLYATGLQDRIIRTEMKIRLRDILDADTLAKAQSLSLSQTIGLRFASDAEMPGLIHKVIAHMALLVTITGKFLL